MPKPFNEPITKSAANPYLRGVAAGFDMAVASIPAYFISGILMEKSWSKMNLDGASSDAVLQSFTGILMTGIFHFHLFLLLLALFNMGGGIIAEMGFHQASWGKRLLHLRVESLNDDEDLTPKQAAIRVVSGVLSWASLNLGHGFAWWRKDRRMLHDLIAKATVIEDEPLSFQEILTRFIPMVLFPILLLVIWFNHIAGMIPSINVIDPAMLGVLNL